MSNRVYICEVSRLKKRCDLKENKMSELVQHRAL